MVLTVLMAVVLVVPACNRRRSYEERQRGTDRQAADTGPGGFQRAETLSAFSCPGINPRRYYDMAGKGKPPEGSSGTTARLAGERAARINAADRLLKKMAAECGLRPAAAARLVPGDLRINEAHVLSETPDGTINVTITVQGKDILELMAGVVE